MKTDMSLYDYLKNQLKNGMTSGELFELLNDAVEDYSAEEEKRKKAEEAKKVQNELEKRLATDVYDAYLKYFATKYPEAELPEDAEKLFMVELNFINYLFTKEYEADLKKVTSKEKEFNDFIDSLFAGLIK